MFLQDHHVRVFPGGPVVKNPPLTAGDMSLTLVGELRLRDHYMRASLVLRW